MNDTNSIMVTFPDHVFALCHLLGTRISNIAARHLQNSMAWNLALMSFRASQEDRTGL